MNGDDMYDNLQLSSGNYLDNRIVMRERAIPVEAQ